MTGVVRLLFVTLIVAIGAPSTTVFAQAASLPQTSGPSRSSDHHHGHSHSHASSHRHDHDHAGKPVASPHGTSESSAGISRNLLMLLAGYSILIACSSLLGGGIAVRLQLTHLQFQLLLSVVGGLLLGIGLFHLLPHAIHELGQPNLDVAMLWVMGGILVTFFLLRSFHVHHHEPDPGVLSHEDDRTPVQRQPEIPVTEKQEHGHHHAHEHGKQLGWTGLFFGLGIHSLLDGVALGAAMQADAGHMSGGLWGLGVMLGIVLHKPLDSLSLTTMMAKAGCSIRARWIANFLYACLCPLGAVAFVLGIWSLGAEGHLAVGCGLAFSAGVFLCIALADLLPEMEFHSHDRWRLSLALLLGIALAWAIRFLEPAHLHE